MNLPCLSTRQHRTNFPLAAVSFLKASFLQIAHNTICLAIRGLMGHLVSKTFNISWLKQGTLKASWSPILSSVGAVAPMAAAASYAWCEQTGGLLGVRRHSSAPACSMGLYCRCRLKKPHVSLQRGAGGVGSSGGCLLWFHPIQGLSLPLFCPCPFPEIPPPPTLPPPHTLMQLGAYLCSAGSCRLI